MRCPVCGSKLYNGVVCKYCKDVTIERIETASNKKAREARKLGKKEDIVYSTYVPDDVNRMKLLLYTLLLGYVGVHDFYVGKIYKGLYNAITVGGAFAFSIIEIANRLYHWGFENSINLLFRTFALLAAFGIILWFRDIFGVLLKKYKVPVILGDKKK